VHGSRSTCFWVFLVFHRYQRRHAAGEMTNTHTDTTCDWRWSCSLPEATAAAINSSSSSSVKSTCHPSRRRKRCSAFSIPSRSYPSMRRRAWIPILHWGCMSGWPWPIDYSERRRIAFWNRSETFPSLPPKIINVHASSVTLHPRRRGRGYVA